MDDNRSDKMLAHCLCRAQKPQSHMQKYGSARYPGAHMQHDKTSLQHEVVFDANGWGNETASEKWLHVGTAPQPSTCDNSNLRKRLHAYMSDDVNSQKM